MDCSSLKERPGLSRMSATVALLIGFYLVNLAASLCCKEGGTNPSRRIHCRECPWDRQYRLAHGRLRPHKRYLAMVLAGSGGFIGSQVLLAWLFHSRLTFVQWIGIALVAVGTAVATLGGPGAAP